MPQAHTTIKLLSALAAIHAFAKMRNCAAMAGMGFGLLLSAVVLAQAEPLDAETKSVEELVPKVVRFNQHVRPILSDNCFMCHGPDKAKRKGDLRLDIRAEAVAAKAIVPGVPADSEIITRIYLPHDEDDLMPPSESHKELSAIEKATLKKWVASGATYETHWAYAAIVRDKTKSIDAWVGARLEAEGLGFSEPADARTLTRRLTLDLTGLPPSPACGPSRSAMLSGLMPARNGAKINHQGPRPETQIMVKQLQAAGYEVAAFGKVAHFPKLVSFDEHFPKKTGLAESVKNYLNQRKSDKPLCLMVGDRRPHVPWTRKMDYDPAKITPFLPISDLLNGALKHPTQKQIPSNRDTPQKANS